MKKSSGSDIDIDTLEDTQPDDGYCHPNQHDWESQSRTANSDNNRLVPVCTDCVHDLRNGQPWKVADPSQKSLLYVGSKRDIARDSTPAGPGVLRRSNAFCYSRPRKPSIRRQAPARPICPKQTIQGTQPKRARPDSWDAWELPSSQKIDQHYQVCDQTRALRLPWCECGGLLEEQPTKEIDICSNCGACYGWEDPMGDQSILPSHSPPAQTEDRGVLDLVFGAITRYQTAAEAMAAAGDPELEFLSSSDSDVVEP